MRLPEDDENYLNEKGFIWELVPDGNGAYLIIRNYAVCPETHDQSITDLMIRIPAGYNNAGLDMFYVDPPIKLRATGAYPQAAESFEDHIGRHWQRFSRHLNSQAIEWRPGVDGIPMYLSLIARELQAKR